MSSSNSDSSVDSDNPANNQENSAIKNYSYFSEADVHAFKLNDTNNHIETTFTSAHHLESESYGSFELSLSHIDDNEWVVVSSTGRHTSSSTDKGILFSLAKARDWRSGGASVNPLTDMAYRYIIVDRGGLIHSSQELLTMLDEMSKRLVGDVNLDGTVNYEDLLSFSIHSDTELLNIERGRIISGYMPAIYSSANDSYLYNRLLRLIETSNDEYKATDQYAYLVNTEKGYVIEASSTNANPSVEYVQIRQLDDDVMSSTTLRSIGDNSNAYRIEYEISGRELILEFITPATFDHPETSDDLEGLVHAITSNAEVVSGVDGRFLKIDIPSSIVSSFSDATMRVLIDGNIYEKDVFTIFSDNPLIGWYFDDLEEEKEYEYTPPTEDIVIPKVYYASNAGGDNIYFNWRQGESSCAAGEVKLGFRSVDDRGDYYRLDTSGAESFILCVGHPSTSLAANRGSLLFWFDPNDKCIESISRCHNVHSGPPIEERFEPVWLALAEKNSEAELEMTRSRHAPVGEGWSCGFSFEKKFGGGKFGDCYEYTENRVWLRIKKPNENGELIMDRYQPIGSQGEIIRDVVTGLEWQRCSVGQTWNPNNHSCDGEQNVYFWNDAMNLTAPGGFRSPTIEELRTIVYCSNTGNFDSNGSNSACYAGGLGGFDRPTIVLEAFPNTWNSVYWSSSPKVGVDEYGAGNAWVIYFGDGGVYRGYEGNIFGALLVRAGR